MRQTIIPSLLTIACSACIGLAVGIALLFVYTAQNPLRHLANSTLVGIMIGTASNIAGFLMHQYGPKNLSWAYLLTFVITLAGSILASLGEPLRMTLIVLAIAEPLALLITFMNIRSIHHLNDSLNRKQAQFKQKRL